MSQIKMLYVSLLHASHQNNEMPISVHQYILEKNILLRLYLIEEGHGQIKLLLNQHLLRQLCKLTFVMS